MDPMHIANGLMDKDLARHSTAFSALPDAPVLPVRQTRRVRALDTLARLTRAPLAVAGLRQSRARRRPSGSPTAGVCSPTAPMRR